MVLGMYWPTLWTIHWALTLSAYAYSITYLPGKEVPDADMLSRLPLPVTIADSLLPPELALLVETLNNSPVNISDSKHWTDRDPVLSRVRNLVQHGWCEDEGDVNLMQQRRSCCQSRLVVFCGAVESLFLRQVV